MTNNYYREHIIDYVLARKCQSGGFCFYRLDEPNGSDTFFALSVLNLLAAEFNDPATVTYLRSMQHPDGSYDSTFAAYYSIQSLALLIAYPRNDPTTYILKNLPHCRFNAERLPVEVLSIFKRTSYIVELCATLNLKIEEEMTDDIVAFILSFQNDDNGFGYHKSTLHETSTALNILRWLGYPVHTLKAESFIHRCEVASYGFTDIPHTSMSFMEYVHAGVQASYLLDCKPDGLDQCERFIRDCQNRGGGFSRTIQGGIATLENTYYAVHALALLSTWNSI